ncbi:hypothetical protein C8J27_103155 [Rhodobacter aestuarii]|uniref:Uncharacterized protein n=1 Tax=Rhodobacter aestuarii TaxID=453582 RepID=A0A1N7K7B0_9RHOB|nr:MULTISPECIES: hypothetical protein [Rhodobacter]PTV95827.1 hypothetical protein C8J27_103155 [Rhodobacter aestuarii]SIS57459.1 hypothetical protein SAMN05421580_102279 [Rhodobacter aestuarii]SOC16962.1 hypothetical protein SAMN05877809_10925 [Rhodobacter sp. JA431]
MRNTVAIAAVALALGTSFASAAEPRQGLQQIADYLGLDAGAYSATELHELLAARDAGDQSTYAYLLERGDLAKDAAASDGKSQLAAQLGLDASAFTSAELTQISDARRDGDRNAEHFLLNHENRNNIYHPVPQIGHDS